MAGKKMTRDILNSRKLYSTKKFTLYHIMAEEEGLGKYVYSIILTLFHENK